MLHGRDPERLASTAAAIERSTGNDRISTHRADLSSLDEVRALADEVQAATDELHVLINNAGIGSGRPDATTRQESRDGHELRFAVNYLAPFLLTLRLLGLLRRSAPAPHAPNAPPGPAPGRFKLVKFEDAQRGGPGPSHSKPAHNTAR